MKIVAISDTHNKLSELKVPDGDVLIHCGDATLQGNASEFKKFAEDLSKLPHKHKIFVPGNHDFLLDIDPSLARSILYGQCPMLNILENRSITIEGIEFFGSPINTDLPGWAFYKNSTQAKSIIDSFPRCDVLITHIPPYGILDKVLRASSGEDPHVGSKFLLDKVMALEPTYHLFGHIHEGYGWHPKPEIDFVNCAVMDYKYRMVNKPYVIHLE